MAYRFTRDEHFQAKTPKRILALDGGGLRGILTLGYLRESEDTSDPSRRRSNSDVPLLRPHRRNFHRRIIAAGLATSMTVEELIDHYQRLG
jgi:hypothetical protein